MRNELALEMVSAFDELPDPRRAHGQDHRLTDLLVIAVCTLLVGGESAYEMEDFGRAREAWLRTFLPLPNGIASHDTFNRLFQALDSAAFAETFAHWTQGLRESLGREVVALDGKAARRAVAALGLKHRFTRPCAPKTNGKAERFIQTSLRSWAYAHAYAHSGQRANRLHAFLHNYNWHRPHHALNLQPPISRLRLPVNNLLSLHS